MSLIPKVKCSRCDRSYSGLKNRCPYCGAHRGRGGKRVTDTGDAQARGMIKLLLLAALVITVISMIFFMDFDSDPADNGSTANQPDTTQGQSETQNEENGDPTEAPPAPSPTPTLPPSIEVTSVGITWQGRVGNTNDITIHVGNTLELRSEIFPTDADADVRWETSANTVVQITEFLNDAGQVDRILIEGRSAGRATITASTGEHTAELIVRVR